MFEVGCELGAVEGVDELGVAGYFGSGEVHVNLRALGEALGAVGVEEQEVAHDDVAGHLDHAARHEVGVDGVVDLGYGSYGLGVHLGEDGEAVFDALEFGTHFVLGVLLDEVAVGAGGDVADCGHNLELGGAFVD